MLVPIFWFSKQTADLRQFHDITQLLEICRHTDLARSAFVLNDQLGRGRSSTTAVIMLLIQRWMTSNRNARQPSSRGKDRAKTVDGETPSLPQGGARISWQVINSCLRVVRNGLEIKRVSCPASRRGSGV